MNTKHIEHIKSYISQYTDENIPTWFTPEKDDENYVYIFSDCLGVVLIPETDGRTTFTYLVEDDGFWFIENNMYANTFWIPDIVKCLNIAQEYLNNNK